MQVVIKYFVILDHTCNKLTFVVILHRGLCVQTIRSRDLPIFKCRYATPSAPQAPERQLERPLSFGDVSSDEPWSSDDEREGGLPPVARTAAAILTSPIAARNLPGSGTASPSTASQAHASPDSEHMSESIPPPMVDADDDAGTPSWSRVFGNLVDQGWSFSEAKQSRR